MALAPVVVLPLAVLLELVVPVVPDSGVAVPVLVELLVVVELEVVLPEIEPVVEPEDDVVEPPEVVLPVEEPPDGVGLAAADTPEVVLVVA